jgi:hypothetical protein
MGDPNRVQASVRIDQSVQVNDFEVHDSAQNRRRLCRRTCLVFVNAEKPDKPEEPHGAAPEAAPPETAPAQQQQEEKS